MAVLVLGLSAGAVRAAPMPAPTPMAGSDRGMHGCIGSAGYTWSNIRKSCIRIFEEGIRLDPLSNTGSKATFSAFIVFAHGREGAYVEVYSLRKKRGVILHRAGLRAWEGGGWRLTRDHGLFKLSRGDGRVIYQGNAAP